MTDFFQLPLEVRQMIYAECLVMGKVFPYTVKETYNEYECDYDDDLTALERSGCETPEVALLLVCKDIYLEAGPLLYQQNTFVLPASDFTSRFLKRSLHNNTRRSWLKSVEMGFDASDMTRDDREATLYEQFELVKDDMLFPEKVIDNYCWPYEDADDWSENMHEAYKDTLAKVVWPRKASYILELPQLQKLIIDFRDSKCLEGCCDRRFQSVSALDKGFAIGMPKSLKLLGLGSAVEPTKSMLELWTSIRVSGSCLEDHLDERIVIQMALDEDDNDDGWW